MTPEGAFGQALGVGKIWRLLEARLEAGSSTFVLKVEETAPAGTSVTFHEHLEPMQGLYLYVFNN